MLIDRILFAIESLGPGKRIVIWTVGCSKHCSKCSNPELWKFDKTKDISVNNITKIIKRIYASNEIDGITITGGDPLEQLDELVILLDQLESLTSDILVYTGYTYENLIEILPEESVNVMVRKVAVLIDGEYIESQNDNKSSLIGSTNQKLHILKDEFREKYELYISQERKIQNVYFDNKMISVGIHNKTKEEKNG